MDAVGRPGPGADCEGSPGEGSPGVDAKAALNFHEFLEEFHGSQSMNRSRASLGRDLPVNSNLKTVYLVKDWRPELRDDLYIRKMHEPDKRGN